MNTPQRATTEARKQGEAPRGPVVAPISWRSIMWVAWRQDRGKLSVLVGACVVMSAFLIVTGQRMRQLWAQLGLDECSLGDISSHVGENQCVEQLQTFLSQPPASLVGYVVWTLHVLPVLVGMFIGAPTLAREFETGTFRLAWTQGVGRRRWLIGKFLFLGTVSGICALTVGLLFSWWYDQFDWVASTGDRWSGEAFGLAGPASAGWTIFAFTLGLFVGLVTRRTVAAMAINAVGSIAAIIVTSWLVRPQVLALGPEASEKPYGSWRVGELKVGDYWLVDGAGHHLTPAEINEVLNQADGVPRAQFDQWLSSNGYTSWLQYQAPTRFWLFQTIEAVGLIAASLLLFAWTLRWVRRRAA